MVFAVAQSQLHINDQSWTFLSNSGHLYRGWAPTCLILSTNLHLTIHTEANFLKVAFFLSLGHHKVAIGFRLNFDFEVVYLNDVNCSTSKERLTDARQILSNIAYKR